MYCNMISSPLSRRDLRNRVNSASVICRYRLQLTTIQLGPTMFRRAVVAVTIFSAIGLQASLTIAASRITKAAGVSWQPAKLVPGSPVLFQVSASASTRDVTGQWFGHEVTFFRPSGATAWSGLAAVPL